MTDNEILLRQAEAHAVARRLLMIVNALSYIAWIGAFGLSQSGHGFDGHLLGLVQALSFPVWLVSLLAIFWTIRRLRQRRDIAGLIDDERTVRVSGRSFQVGYWGLLLAITGLFAASFFIPLDVRLVAPFLLALGVAAPSLTYAWLYRS